MNEADKEIIKIVKELFRNKSNEIIDQDELLRERIVKWFIYVAAFSLLIVVPLKIFGNIKDSVSIDGGLSIVLGIAFTLFFIHLNIKSKNPSIIMHVLTWLSLMISLWLAGG